MLGRSRSFDLVWAVSSLLRREAAAALTAGGATFLLLYEVCFDT